MIELRGITFGYADRTVLDSVDLTLEEGEMVVVSGRTGVGKSTLLGVLTGLVPTFTGGTLRGDVLLDGRSILHQPPRERAHLIGYVGQDPQSGFVTDTVEEELAYGMEQLGLPAGTMRRRVEETLDLLGLNDLRTRNLVTLSGGEQQRVAIGSVLTMHPRLLVLDEPTSALDPTAAEDVLATLRRLVEDLGLTVLMAEHRLERVVPFADRWVLLTGDGGIEVGDPAEVLVRAPVAPPLVELGRLAGWDPLPLTVREARRLARELRTRLLDAGAGPDVAGAPAASPDGHTGASARRSTGAPGSTPASPEVLLHAARVAVTHDRVPAVQGVDLSLRAGGVTVLMGRNGSGKSSLIWALQGTGRRSAGRVLVSGRDPAELDAAARRSAVGLVPQTARDLLYLETVREECEASDEGAGVPSGTCLELLGRLVPGIDLEAHPRDLSEGQRLALVLAVVLTAAPRVVLLDEPTRGLDYPAKEGLARILDDLAADGRAVLVATHDVEFAARVADQVMVLAEGEVVSDGAVRDVLAESPAFAPQVTKVLGPPWLRVDEVDHALRGQAGPRTQESVGG